MDISMFLGMLSIAISIASQLQTGIREQTREEREIWQ